MRYPLSVDFVVCLLAASTGLGACSSPATGAGSASTLHERPTVPPAEEPTTEALPFMQLHFIDVGQGAATLLEFSCGAVLIDTGGERQPSDHRGSGCPRADHIPPATYDGSAQLLDYLHAFFERRADLGGRLSALYLTHPHVDHTRGAPAVMRAFQVGVLVTNGQDGGSGACEQREAEQLAAAGPDTRVVHVANPGAPLGLTDEWIDPVTCSDLDPELRVLFGRVDAGVAHAGWSATDLRNENEHSVVLRVQLGRFSALFTGDLETQGIQDLLAQTAPEALDVDLYHVGHHGSHNATTAALLAALTPATAVISMGSPTREASYSAWHYGHPRAPVVALLAASLSGRAERRSVLVATGQHAFESMEIDAALYATGWDGDVVIRAEADGRHARVQP
jgi:competence protein ComEC